MTRSEMPQLKGFAVFTTRGLLRTIAATTLALGVVVSGSSVTHAAAPTLISCGTTTVTGASTTTTIAVTGGTLFVGADIILMLSDDSGAFGPITAADDAANVYVSRTQTTNSTPPPTLTTAVLDSLGIAAVPTTITITHPSASARVARCFVNNSASPLMFASVGTGTGENATVTTGSALVPAVPGTGLVVTAVGNRDDTAYTPSNGSYTDLTDASTGTTDADVTNHAHYLTTLANGTYNANGTLTDIEGWAAIVAAYSYALNASVDLANLRAVRVGTQVRLNWTTLSERENAGFRVMREGLGRRLIEVTPRMIPARGDAVTLTRYSFTDRAAPSVRARYWLVDVDVNGRMTRHGPLLVGPVLRGSGLDELESDSPGIESTMGDQTGSEFVSSTEVDR